VAATYVEALEYLYSFTDVERVPGLAPAASFDLAKVHRFFDLIGRPERQFRAILVAGTKGKGSTASYIASALRAAGYHVGLYTQPHLTSFRERMQVDGALLPAERLGPLVDALRPFVDRMRAEAPEYGPLTTYEIATALALRYFAEERVEYAVLEIGLGGRLDAVNAVRAPLVSVITSLSLDHTRVLGDTIEQIAFEKAGIIKAGVPVVTAPQPAGALGVIEQTAAERGAPLYLVGRDVTLAAEAPPAAPCDGAHQGRARRRTQRVTVEPGARLGGPAGRIVCDLPLLGAYQALNAAVAGAACLLLAAGGATRLTPAAIAQGFAHTEWPGRLEIVQERPLLLLDGAHNGASASELAVAIQTEFCYRRVVLVLGLSADKDSTAILRPLLPLAQAVIFTRSRHPRAAAPDVVAAQARELAPEAGREEAAPAFHVAPDVSGALETARRLAGPQDAILVTGSLFVVGDARAALGLGPPVDEVSGDFFYRLDPSPPAR
jgi:dihydrofolate synthase / folylpolyglutamate synthase